MNVKSVVLRDDPSEFGRSEVVVNARAAGPRLGKDVQRVIKAVKSGNWQVRAGADGQEVVVADGIELIDGEYTRKLVATAPDSTAELPGGAGLVVLDTTVTPELEAEGWARTASASCRRPAATWTWTFPTASSCGWWCRSTARIPRARIPG